MKNLLYDSEKIDSITFIIDVDNYESGRCITVARRMTKVVQAKVSSVISCTKKPEHSKQPNIYLTLKGEPISTPK